MIDKNMGSLTTETDDAQILHLDDNPFIALDQLVDALWQNAENTLTDSQCVDAQAMAQKLIDLMNKHKSLDNIVFSVGALTAFKSFTGVLTEALEN